MSRSLPPRSPTGAPNGRATARSRSSKARRRRSSSSKIPDILSTIAHRKTGRPRLVIGFAAETDDVIANAKAKLAKKGCDWILANDVSPETGIMGGDANTIHLISSGGVEDWPPQSKDDVAHHAGGARRQRARQAACGKQTVSIDVRIVRLPHGADLPLPAYQSALAAGLDLVAAVPADAPIQIAPGARALDSHRRRDCVAAGSRGAGPAALGARATPWRHGSELTGHDRRRLSRGNTNHPCKSRIGALCNQSRNAYCAASNRADITCKTC